MPHIIRVFIMIDLLSHISNIDYRAMNLNCNVIAILGNHIFCHRPGDDSYVTWRACASGITAVFDSGHYDMDRIQGEASLLARSGFGNGE